MGVLGRGRVGGCVGQRSVERGETMAPQIKPQLDKW